MLVQNMVKKITPIVITPRFKFQLHHVRCGRHLAVFSFSLLFIMDIIYFLPSRLLGEINRIIACEALRTISAQ